MNWLTPALTREDYVAIVSQLLAFYAPIERRLEMREEWAWFDFPFGPRRKVPLLLRDLHNLGVPALEVAGLFNRVLNRADDLPSVETFEQALGCLYVLEGSTLGGKVISRHLQATLGIGPGNGGAFFSSYGEDLGKMWRGFVKFLEDAAARSSDREKIVASACETFSKFEHWFGTDARVAEARVGEA